MKRKKKIDSLQFRVSELERLIFGVKSERFVAATGPEQGHLILEVAANSKQKPLLPKQSPTNGKIGEQQKAITASAACPSSKNRAHS
ncbi:MAG: hypothetical protein IPN68_16765 [Bacteroidetes bacterium]|nr:hypothetical protein [Bacteroidota bacterium]